MRVVLVSRRADVDQYSIEKVFKVLLPHMKSSGINVSVEVCPYYNYGLLNKLKALFWARKLDGDVFHIIGDVYYLALVLRKRPLLITYHDFAFISRETSSVKRWLLKIFWVIIPAKAASKLIAISQRTLQDLGEYLQCPTEKLGVIPNPLTIDTKYYNRMDVGDILHIGTKSNKNLERTIRALRGLNLTLSIVGSLTEEHKILLRETNVKYSTYKNLSDAEIVGLYKSHKVLSFCSLSEGFGLPILEALACGTPVITSDIEPMKNIAKDYCILVNPHDEACIHSVFANLDANLANMRDKIVEISSLLQKYEPSVIGAEYIDEYRSLLQRLD